MQDPRSSRQLPQQSSRPEHVCCCYRCRCHSGSIGSCGERRKADEYAFCSLFAQKPYLGLAQQRAFRARKTGKRNWPRDAGGLQSDIADSFYYQPKSGMLNYIKWSISPAVLTQRGFFQLSTYNFWQAFTIMGLLWRRCWQCCWNQTFLNEYTYTTSI